VAQSDFDCIVVGAGPAGISAAITMVSAGLSVAVLERGEYPGAKNMSGGILLSTVLDKLVPDFYKDAPLERHISKRKFSLVSDNTELAFELRTKKWDSPPYNNSFTILRAKFDRWFADKAKESGAEVICSILAKELIIENQRIVGVMTEPGGDKLLARCVIDAEGANPLLARQAGLADHYNSRSVGLGVKQVISLPREVIEERFSLEGDQGAAFHYFGECVKGYFGGAFLYTNKESVSLGIVLLLSHLALSRTKPGELVDAFIRNQAVSNYLRGGELSEFSAHLIPEGGYYALPERLVADGLILVGDAAGLVNASFYYEGSNLAMASGVAAGETVIEAKKRNDFSRKSLASYEEKLKESFVIKDLFKFRNLKRLLQAKPWILNRYPKTLADAVVDYFTASEMPKSEVEKEVRRKIKKEIGYLNVLKTLWTLYRGTR
jgi:electron transfer flavoprotein-quinone oxidoreductase